MKNLKLFVQALEIAKISNKKVGAKNDHVIQKAKYLINKKHQEIPFPHSIMI